MTSDASLFWTVHCNSAICRAAFMPSLLGFVLYVGWLGIDVLLQSPVRHPQAEAARQVREADSETTLPFQVRSPLNNQQ